MVYELGHALLAGGRYDAAVTICSAQPNSIRESRRLVQPGQGAGAGGTSMRKLRSSCAKQSDLNPKDPEPALPAGSRPGKTRAKIEEARAERERFAELKKAQPPSAGMATGRDQ